MWVVIKQGVYMHGTWGPYPSEAEAVVNARRLATLDTDDHHSWEVWSIDGKDGLKERAYSCHSSRSIWKGNKNAPGGYIES